MSWQGSMFGEEIVEIYFDWLYKTACHNRSDDLISYRKLLLYLYDTVFTWSPAIPMDGNRAEDGISLRRRFALSEGFGYEIYDYLNGPCSVLEMMLALAIRCEEDYMDDPLMGNRTSQWFWNMVVNLGLGAMDDSKYDHEYVESCVLRFLNRDYEPDGRGGLFRLRTSTVDLRDVEIWDQCIWYIGTLI